MIKFNKLFYARFCTMLWTADDKNNVEKLVLYLSDGNKITCTGSKRLCQVAINEEVCEVIAVGFLNDEKTEREHRLPYYAIEKAEVYEVNTIIFN